jgi:DNA mismatch endonuclease (patch repair protein)
MKGNRRANTKPELALRSALHARGLRFRKDHQIEAGSVRVKADVAFTRRRVAVFVDGCFWHGCPEHGNKPRANTEYWAAKLARNADRDRRVDAALTADGWDVIRLWEHIPAKDAAATVERALSSRDTAQRAI